MCQEASSIPGLTVHFSIFLERPVNPLKDLFALIEMVIFIKRNRIETVHTHSSKAGILGRIAALIARVRPVIHTVHGWSFNDFQRPFFRRVNIRLERFAASFTDRIITVSQSDLDRGLKEGIGKKEQYVLIRHGIDFSAIDAAGKGARGDFGIGEGIPFIGMTACLKVQKAPQDFIRVAAAISRQIPEARFIIAGDGPLRPALERLIGSVGLSERVILAGWRFDIPRILASLDLFILTSLWEGLPVSAIEAMYSGITVLATQTGGIAEFITDGETGFLFPPGKTDEIAEKAVELLRDSVTRRRTGENARRRVRFSFPVEDMVSRVSGLYLESGSNAGAANV